MTDQIASGEAAAPVASASTRSRKQTSFAADVLKLVSGTAVAQGIGVLATPLLTRLYGPEAFGTLALFTSITSIIGVVACLRYELAIMLPESDEEAANLLAVSLLAVVGVTLLTVPIVTWGRGLLLRLVNAPQLGKHLWAVPVAVLFGGVFQAVSYWNSRTKRFGRLSAAKVANAATAHAVKLGAALVGHAGDGTLIGGTLVGLVLSTGLLTRKVRREDGSLLRRSVLLERMRRGVIRYRNFPLVDLWGALLNTFSWQLPALVLGHFFSSVVVGHWALGLRVLQLPMSLVGAAIGQVFYQRAAEAVTEGDLGAVVLRVHRALLFLAALPFALLAVSGREFFVLVFGSSWQQAGVYAQILSLGMLAWFLSSPLSTLYRVLERQTFSLGVNVAIVVTRFLALAAGGLMGNEYVALGLFSLSGVLVYGYYGAYALRISGVAFRSTMRAMAQEAMWVAPGVLLLLVVKTLTRSELVCTLTAGGILAGYGLAALRYRADLREVTALLGLSARRSRAGARAR